MTGGEVTTTSTSRDNYAMYIYDYDTTANISNAVLNAPNASGIQIDAGTINISDTVINAGHTSAYGINHYLHTLNINEGTEINTPGADAIGIWTRYNSVLNYNAGIINSNNIGIYMQDSANVRVYGGEIYAKRYGIREINDNNSLTIGRSSDELSISVPKIQGDSYALYKGAGRTYYYNGLLSGGAYGYNFTFDALRPKMKIVDDLSDNGNIDDNTINTLNKSEEPVSEYSKIGNGYAKITYIGESTDDCENGHEYKFDYTGEENTFEATCAGKYKLEVWGAQGGYSLCDGSKCGNPGYGGYSKAEIELEQNEVLYINVGGQGGNGSKTSCAPGGYNGGGKGANDGGGCGTANDDEAGGAGGGATHIATTSGLLSTLENKQDKIIIVAGGGGGSSWNLRGGSGGGTKGGTTPNTVSTHATQIGGYSFGKGQDGSGGRQGNTCYHGVSPSCNGVAGGGGGFYGGYTQDKEDIESGTGGSGYIGNERLTNAKMYGFNLNGAYIYNYFTEKENFLMVDSEEFNSINDAVAYIKENKNGVGTILLMKDASINENATFAADTTITFDLQGHTLTTTSRIYNKGILKVINGTIKDLRDDVIQNENDLTVENATLTAAPNYTSIYGNNANGKVSIKNTTLNGGAYGSILNTKHELTVENSTINVSDTGITMRVSGSKLDFKSGTIDSGNIGIRLQDSQNSVVNITTGTINSANQGIYESGSGGSNITIDYAEITSRNSNAIQLYSYSVKSLTIKDGKYKGAENGIYLRYTNLNMTGGEVTTTSTSRDYYAMYIYDYDTTANIYNAVLKAPNASGIQIDAGTVNLRDTEINSGASSGYGINHYLHTLNIYEGTKINTTGTSSIGIYGRNSSSINIYDGNINSAATGIYIQDSCVLNVNGGRIIGKNYGIYETASGNTVNMGTKNYVLSIYEPYVEGDLYGLYKTSGTMNFYNGRLKGSTKPYYGTFNNIRAGHDIYEGPEGAGIEARLRNTINTDTHSSDALENTPKEGNGSVKITYRKNEYIESQYKDQTENEVQNVFDYDYNGSFYTFEAPSTDDYQVELWGAQGGTNESAIGGKGAYTKGIIHLTRGEKLYVYVGGAGGTSAGYNGGGFPYSTSYGRGGGGATDIRLVSGPWNDSKGLSSRIMVAGAGGGAYKYYNSYVHNGAPAGTLVGKEGTATNTCISTGGTQVSGGNCSLSTAGNGSCGRGGNGSGASSGGGSGYYGGAGRYDKSGSGSGAGGGSSYISGYTGSIAITSETNRSPRKDSNNEVCEPGTTDNLCSKHYSGKVFTDTVMYAGDESMPDYTTGSSMIGNSGNGHARITRVQALANANSGSELDENNQVKYSYTGTEQTFIVPKTGYYKLETWGASGGKSITNSGWSYTDLWDTYGYGGYASGTIYLQKNEKLYIYVGEQGKQGVMGSGNVTGISFNGGGSGMASTDNDDGGGGGGGATDIRLVNGDWDDFDSLKSRIIVAGGGSGSAVVDYNFNGRAGGSGGGISADGSVWNYQNVEKTNHIYNATQTTGYKFGKGENGSSQGNAGGAGAGGGYMGGIASRESVAGGAGGGSGYVSGCDQCFAISESSTENNVTFTNQSIHYSGKVFNDITLKNGNESIPTHNGVSTMVGNNGNGYAVITKLNNEYKYNYTGSEQVFTAPKSGTYQLETWGAQGGSADLTNIGGYGG